MGQTEATSALQATLEGYQRTLTAAKLNLSAAPTEGTAEKVADEISSIVESLVNNSGNSPKLQPSPSATKLKEELEKALRGEKLEGQQTTMAAQLLELINQFLEVLTSAIDSPTKQPDQQKVSAMKNLRQTSLNLDELILVEQRLGGSVTESYLTTILDALDPEADNSLFPSEHTKRMSPVPIPDPRDITR